MLSSRVSRFLQGQAKWRNSRRHMSFKQHYGQLFVDYKKSCQAFLCFEFVVSIVTGVLEGLRPAEKWGCKSIIVVALALNFLVLVVLLVKHPFIAPCHQIHAVLMVGLTCASILFLVIAQFKEGDELLQTAESLSMIAIFLGVLKALLDVFAVIQKITVKITADKHTKKTSTRARGKSVSDRLLAALSGENKNPSFVNDNQRRLVVAYQDFSFDEDTADTSNRKNEYLAPSHDIGYFDDEEYVNNYGEGEESSEAFLLRQKQLDRLLDDDGTTSEDADDDGPDAPRPVAIRSREEERRRLEALMREDDDDDDEEYDFGVEGAGERLVNGKRRTRKGEHATCVDAAACSRNGSSRLAANDPDAPRPVAIRSREEERRRLEALMREDDDDDEYDAVDSGGTKRKRRNKDRAILLDVYGTIDDTEGSGLGFSKPRKSRKSGTQSASLFVDELSQKSHITKNNKNKKKRSTHATFDDCGIPLLLEGEGSDSGLPPSHNIMYGDDRFYSDEDVAACSCREQTLSGQRRQVGNRSLSRQHATGESLNDTNDHGDDNGSALHRMNRGSRPVAIRSREEERRRLEALLQGPSSDGDEVHGNHRNHHPGVGLTGEAGLYGSVPNHDDIEGSGFLRPASTGRGDPRRSRGIKKKREGILHSCQRVKHLEDVDDTAHTVVSQPSILHALPAPKRADDRLDGDDDDDDEPTPETQDGVVYSLDDLDDLLGSNGDEEEEHDASTTSEEQTAGDDDEKETSIVVEWNASLDHEDDDRRSSSASTSRYSSSASSSINDDNDMLSQQLDQSDNNDAACSSTVDKSSHSVSESLDEDLLDLLSSASSVSSLS